MENVPASYLIFLKIPFMHIPFFLPKMQIATCFLHNVFSIGDTGWWFVYSPQMKHKRDWWSLVLAMRGKHFVFKKVYCNICTLGIFLHCTIQSWCKCVNTSVINWRWGPTLLLYASVWFTPSLAIMTIALLSFNHVSCQLIVIVSQESKKDQNKTDYFYRSDDSSLIDKRALLSAECLTVYQRVSF